MIVSLQPPFDTERFRIVFITTFDLERNRFARNLSRMESRRRISTQDALHPRTTRAIWRAVILELARTGYQALSMEQVARRAGVGKAALYRRWSGREAMMLDLVASIEFPIIAAPDRGNLQDDLLAYLTGAAHLFRRPLARRLLPELYAEMSRGGALGNALRDKLLGLKGLQLQGLIDRAIARSEISPSTDLRLASALIVGPLYWAWIIERRSFEGASLSFIAKSLATALSTSD
ncbi:TetR/AcrR family transcriptional regulator [Aquibaculum arenosum]|uniref:TetR/AcrR family transcriptional regulator n=1 Tax=Aquibaculum arenosum TaxID=3032591 RepID=A0ABT5YJ69_9PROT|nr:TetR/AcrR family transcriptional regulator [Fodinicurvata sp. CAU 1616]MDF2094934.1 TetR/AcrR family transcriptional regulator [Fodinicurvata sp. CAU 1616]